MPSSRPTDFYRLIIDELRPYPGRLASSLRITVCCVIVVVLAMSQQVPEAALSCYLVFFANRDNAASGIVIALGLILAASLGIMLGVVFLQLASGNAMLRLALIAAFTFGGMYLSVATSAGSIAATTGFVFAFVLTLDDFVPVPELLARGLRWMWWVVFFPMATLVLVNALSGKGPLPLARSAIAERLAAAAGLLRGDRGERRKAAQLLAEDPSEMNLSMRLGTLLGYGSSREADRVSAGLAQAQGILAGTLAATPDRALASGFQRLAGAIEKEQKLPGDWVPPSSGFNEPLARAGASLAGTLSGRSAATHGGMELTPASSDMFSNPEYLHFAIKTLLAVFITYGIYTVRDWFEIHTAMITCFYVALGTTGETLHKATLRIIGCLLGAVLGVGSILFLMPHMTDIGHLMLLVGVCTFVAAWVANGSSLIEYAGWQMALAFFLCVLHGFGPSLDVAVATDRILGILIGNVVVALVFLTLWPTSVSASMGRHLSNGAKRLAAALRSPSQGVVEAATEIGEAQRLARLSVFEPNWLRTRSPVLPEFAALMQGSDIALPEIARLKLLRERPRFLWGAPRSVKAATAAQEANLAGFLNIAAAVMVQPTSDDRTRLNRSLQQAEASLGRLERLSSTKSREAWRRDLLDLIDVYRTLVRAFSRTLEAL